MQPVSYTHLERVHSVPLGQELLCQIGDRVQHAVRPAAVAAQVDDELCVFAGGELSFDLGGKLLHRQVRILKAFIILHIQRATAQVEQLVVCLLYTSRCV